MRNLRLLLLPAVLLLAFQGFVATADSGYCGNNAWPPPAPPNPDPPQCNPNPDPDNKCCPDPKVPCDASPCTASPCYAGSGTYVTEAWDLSVPVVGRAIRVNRSYSSARLVDGILGVGNSSILQARLYYATYLFAAPSTYRSVADVVMPDGRHYRFVETTPGQFTPPATRTDVLIRNADGSFDLTLQKSRTVIHYLATGNVASIQDDAGNLTLFSDDASDRLSRIADGSGSGRYVDVHWGADGRIAMLQDSANRTVSYTYNPDGSVESVTDPAARETTFSYVTGRLGSPLLSRVTDHWGRVITDITYFSTNQVSSYDRVSSYTENGETWRMSYDYENDPKQTAKLDSANNVWKLRFGADIQITERIAPDNTATNTVYSPEGWVQQQTDQAGVQTTYTYDTAGKVTSVSRDALAATAVRYDYGYDAAFPEKVAAVTPRDPTTNLVDPDWQAWSYDYYPAGSASPGSLHHVYRVKSDGTTLETVATYEYDTHGRVTRQTSATGGQTDYVHDASGNLHTVTAPANNDAGTRPVTTYGYDSLGRVTSVTDPLGHATTYTYDPLGRVLTVTLPKPSGGSNLDFTTTYAYDNFDAATGLVFTDVTDPNRKLTRLGYDQYGRLVKSIDAGSNETTYAYTLDVLASITDANGNVTGYQYDAQRRLTRTTFPDGAYETYTYKPDGLLWTKTDRRGVTITYGYDGQKRLVSKGYSSGGAVTYTYQGQLLTQVQDTSVSPAETHDFTYDSSYRLATASQGSRGSLAYTYDAGDRVDTASILPGPTVSAYGYYPDGSLRTIDWDPVAGSFRWDYTLRGQYATTTLPNGQRRSYSYDDQGRLLQLANTKSFGGAGLRRIFDYTYDFDHATGALEMLGQRTGRTETSLATGELPSIYYYDPLYQLTGETVQKDARSWTYDDIGNRLTETSGGSTASYSYLHNGSNPEAGQRLANAHHFDYTYDAAGNLASRYSGGIMMEFGYDSENRLASIAGSTQASYTYDYQGRRTSKTAGGVTTTYLYDGLNLVAETTNGVRKYFLNGPGIDEPLAMATNGAVSYFSVDGLGSVVATNTPSGSVTHFVLFDAWGNVKSETGTRNHPFTFTGREVGEAGFHFYRARFYQPNIGRFSQEDPLAGPAGFAGLVASMAMPSSRPNLLGSAELPSLMASPKARLALGPSDYAYVRNRPTTLVDPLGLEPFYPWEKPPKPSCPEPWCQPWKDCFMECWNVFVSPDAPWKVGGGLAGAWGWGKNAAGKARNRFGGAAFGGYGAGSAVVCAEYCVMSRGCSILDPQRRTPGFP